MSGVDHVNQELARLDAAMRSGSLDRDTFRARRRKVLLDFEERQTVTTPGATGAPRDDGHQSLLADQPLDLSFDVAPPPPAVETATPAGKARSPGLVGTALAALLIAAAGLWWLWQSLAAPDSSPAPTVSAGAPVAAPASADLPQSAAADLLATEWTEADVATFLQRWNRLPLDAIRAARDDPRIWLLRGETDRRLRDAREAGSLESSEQSQRRVRQLEQLQAALRSP